MEIKMFNFKTSFGAEYICECIVSAYRDGGAFALQLIGAEDSPYERRAHSHGYSESTSLQPR